MGIHNFNTNLYTTPTTSTNDEPDEATLRAWRLADEHRAYTGADDYWTPAETDGAEEPAETEEAEEEAVAERERETPEPGEKWCAGCERFRQGVEFVTTVAWLPRWIWQGDNASMYDVIAYPVEYDGSYYCAKCRGEA